MDMRRYTVETPAGALTVQLDDEEAKARGLKPAAAQPEKAAESAEPAKRKSTAQKRAEVADRSFGGGAKKKPA
jgi:hypothetical protein